MRKIIRNIFWLSIILLILALSTSSCEKIINAKPPSNTINSGNVYANDATAIGAVTNIYANMSKSYLPGGGLTSLSLFPALSSDELSLYGNATNNSVSYFYKNALTADNLNSPDFWTVCYQTIFAVNAAVEGLIPTTTLTPLVKQQLLGEAKFIRAFCYFYLVNLYGDVPLTISTDYKDNAKLARATTTQVYEQIIRDLTDAQGLLNNIYIDATLLAPSSERVRPIKWAATALLSRTYLYTGDWANAEVQATAVINNNALYDTVSLNNTFLKNNREAIWQLQPVNAGWNTETARIFILPSSGPNESVQSFYLSAFLLNSFESGDKRKANWTNSVTINSSTYYYAYKYKSANYNDPVTEYETVFRLAEQYLIRAEARAQQSKILEAQSDLNIIRKRAGLGNTSANDKASLIGSILHERQVELFSEWGHRWLDLKRTGSVDAVMSTVTPQKGGIWNSTWQEYPISKNELSLNPNLIQNKGY